MTYIVFSSFGDSIKAEISKITQKLIPSWTSFVVQLAALIILILIVVYVAYKPMKKMLKKRADYVENNIKDSEQNKALAAQNAKQSEEMILSSKREASQIIEAANKEALVQKESVMETTRSEVKQMKIDAEKDIERSRQDTLDSVHKEMVDVALAASSEILKREVNEEDNARLAEEFIKKLD